MDGTVLFILIDIVDITLLLNKLIRMLPVTVINKKYSVV